MRIYISGKVTDGGNSEISAETKEAFAEAERQIKAQGHIPVNPLKLCRFDWTWEKCMEVCLAELLKCDDIILLPGWEDSKGARIEAAVAEELFGELKVVLRQAQEPELKGER